MKTFNYEMKFTSYFTTFNSFQSSYNKDWHTWFWVSLSGTFKCRSRLTTFETCWLFNWIAQRFECFLIMISILLTCWCIWSDTKMRIPFQTRELLIMRRLTSRNSRSLRRMSTKIANTIFMNIIIDIMKKIKMGSPRKAFISATRSQTRT